MPSISDSQWSAIRRTAAAVAREVATEIVKSGPAMGHHRLDAIEERLEQLLTPAVLEETAPLNMQLKLYPTTAAISVVGGSRCLTVDQFDGLGRFIGTDEVSATEEGQVRNVLFDVHQAYSPLSSPRAVYSGKCPVDFSRPTENRDPAFQAELRKQRSQTKPKLTGPKPEYKSPAKAPPYLPAGEFWMVCDARCYAYGGSPERNLPWIINPGKVMHGSEEDARDEARRLSEEHNIPYVVLRATHIIMPPTVQAGSVKSF